jgi:uncharacterized protein with gpF-like domain
MFDDFAEHFADADDVMRARLFKCDISRADYDAWRRSAMSGPVFDLFADSASQLVALTEEESAALINAATPLIFREAYNFTAYGIEAVHASARFDLYDTRTVDVLRVTRPDLLPTVRSNQAKAYAWARRRIVREIEAAIVSGDTIPQIATRMRSVTRASEAAAIRNARTAITAAHGGGRQACYEAAAAQGLELRKQWVCAIDDRTRTSHALLDGETVGINDRFSNGLRFPGDPMGPAYEVYNCRCTMVTVDPLSSAGRRRGRNDAGRNVVRPYATYSQWRRMKRGGTP